MYARSALILGPLRLSPLAVAVSISLFVHAGLLTALHYPHRTPNPHPPLPPAIVTFSLGQPVPPTPPVTVEATRQEPPLALPQKTKSVPGLTAPRLPAPFFVDSPSPPPAAMPTPSSIQAKQRSTRSTPPVKTNRKSQLPIVTLPSAPDPPLAIPNPTPESPTAPPGHDAGIAILNLPAPVYPRSCRRHGHEGVVKVRVEIDTHVRVKSVHIIKSGGCIHLDRAALKAARQGHYTPAQRKGKPVPDAIVIPFRFVLK